MQPADSHVPDGPAQAWTPEPAVLAGHSHTLAMGAPKPRGTTPQLVALIDHPYPIHGLQATAANGDAGRYWEDLSVLCGGRPIVLSWMGNQHNSGFLFRRRRAFYVMSRSGPDAVPSGSTLIPASVFASSFVPTIHDLSTTISFLRAAGAGPIYLLSTPPPKADGPEFRQRIRSSPKFSAIAGKFKIDLSDLDVITADAVRRRLWSLLQDMLANCAAANGCRHIPVPESVMDPAGMLKFEYWAEDVTHANRAYGEVVLADVSRALHRDRAPHGLQATV